MSETDEMVWPGLVRAIPVLSLTTSKQLIGGPGRLMGWSFREVGSEAPVSAEGSLTSPGAGSTIVSLGTLPAGTYLLNWAVELSGTIAAAELNNFGIAVGGVNTQFSVNPAAAGLYAQQQIEIVLTSPKTVVVFNTGAGTVGAVYSAQISAETAIANQAALEMQDGNNPLGEISAQTAGVMTQWFGPQGVSFYNQITAAPIVGLVTGVVYVAFDRLSHVTR